MRVIFIVFALVGLWVSAAWGQQSVPIGLEITVSNQTCSLVEQTDATATPEAAEEAGASSAAATAEAFSDMFAATLEPSLDLSADGVLTLGSDCFEVTPHLQVARNGTLWMALAIPNEPDWQRFTAIEGDPYPPKFDKRGRFVGCSIPVEGEQVCRFGWDNFGEHYVIEIPVLIGRAYVAPAQSTGVSTAVSTPVPPPVSTPNSGVWGDCGSCTTCGGPVEHCVLAPDGMCVWDARRCENPLHPDP